MDAPAPAPDRKPGDPIKLREPVQFGSETITELTLKFSPRAVKDLKITMTPDGGQVFSPYDLASAGVRMAGYPDAVFQNLKSGQDLMDIAMAALLFLS